jgi:hypothetical protein
MQRTRRAWLTFRAYSLSFLLAAGTLVYLWFFMRFDRINRVSGARIDVGGRAATVVAVEAFAEIHKILGLLPRAQDDRDRRRTNACVSASGVVGNVTVDLEVVAVAAHTGDGA